MPTQGTSGSIHRKLSRFARVSPGRRALLAEAAVWLVLSRLALALVPFPVLGRRLGAFVGPVQARALQSPATAAQAAIALEIGWAVKRAARHVPFKAVCLPQAMAARLMLSRRGVKSILHFGAAKGVRTPIAAHAWLDVAGVEVTGYPVDGRFTEIACFV
jgi:hypothetical protein